MDILSISKLPGLSNDNWNSGGASQKSERAAVGGQGKDTDRDNANTLKPEDLYDGSKLRANSLNDYHGLNIKEAQMVLAGLAPQIADMNPWKAADLQRVTASKLIPSAYV